jgi:hypothetical protein
MATYVAVDTAVGRLSGRDCIYLDEISFADAHANTLVLKGELNGNLCSNAAVGSTFSYVATFDGVMALEMLELDSWRRSGESSFDEVQDSDWVSKLGGKVTSEHRQFQLQTYDLVFNIVCSGFNFETVRLDAT